MAIKTGFCRHYASVQSGALQSLPVLGQSSAGPIGGADATEAQKYMSTPTCGDGRGKCLPRPGMPWHLQASRLIEAQ